MKAKTGKERDRSTIILRSSLIQKKIFFIKQKWLNEYTIHNYEFIILKIPPRT